MRIIRIILAALFSVAAFSCQKESFGGAENARETESATIVAGEMTKTSLNGNNIYWTSDDVIAVYDNFSYKNKFNILDAEANYAAFDGEVTTGTTLIYAVYPYQLAGAISGSTIEVTIPVDQTSKVGSFAEEHNISVAKGEKTPGVEAIQNVTFKNVGSFLKFTIPSYVEDAKSVTFSTSRAIAGAATVDASADTPVAVVAENGSKSVTMTGSYPAGSQFMFVLSSGDIQGFTVTVVTEKATWSISRNTTVTFAPGQYKNLGTLELEQVGVSATATHTYSGNTLTGTTVNVALNIPAATQQYASDINIEVKNEDGTVVRTVSKSTLSASETLAATAEWPYLPQGTYTVSGSYKLGETVKNISTTFTSPEPTFVVTPPQAYTSYTKYAAGSVNEANGLNGETIYNVTSATVSIADAIVNNSNYSSLVGGYTYKVGGNVTTSETVKVQALGQHTVTAAYSFDGIQREGSATCYVTGLPYSFTFHKNELNFDGEGWTCNGDTGWQSNLLWLSKNLVSNSYGWVASPPIYAPADIKTNIELKTKFYAAKLGWFSEFPTMTFYLGVTSNPSVSVNTVSGTNTATNNTSSTKDVVTFSTNKLTISSGTQYISINHNNAKDTTSYFYLYSYRCLYDESQQ